jgi:hypothetical protein
VGGRGAKISQHTDSIPFGPTLDDLPATEAAACDSSQRFLPRRGSSAGSPPEYDRFVVGAQLVYHDAQIGKYQAVQRRADLDGLGTADEIRDHPVVIHVADIEQLISHLDMTTIPDRFDRPAYFVFVDGRRHTFPGAAGHLLADTGCSSGAARHSFAPSNGCVMKVCHRPPRPDQPNNADC